MQEFLLTQGEMRKDLVEVEKCHLVVKMKLKMLNLQKMTFLISTLAPGDTIEL